jgi:PTH2 family peptidyl-tRNA hydrolase
MWNYKQVIVVRKDLEMSPAKLAVQVAHASIGGFIECVEPDDSGKVLDEWYKDSYQKKVVLQVRDMKALKDFIESAHIFGYRLFQVRDAGKTELEPDTLTCVGFAPMKNEHIDILTGNLKIYR